MMQEPQGDTVDSGSKRVLHLDDLWHLVDVGLLATADWQKAISGVRDDESWRLWIMRIIYALGVVHLLAGVIFFFAYNWADLTKELKFTLLFGGLVASFALWWGAGPDSRVGRSGGITATVLTGVLMAVFGQIYQTGADAHDLFVVWAALTLPWAIISKSPTHLLVWVLICNTALSLFSRQVMGPVWAVDWTYMMLMQAGLNGLLLMALLFARRTQSYLSSMWLYGILVLGLIIPVTVASWDIVSSVFNEAVPMSSRGPELFAVLTAQALILWAFLRRLVNIFASVMALASLISSFVVLVLVITDRFLGHTNAFSLFLMAIIVAGATGIFIWQARHMAASMRGSDGQ